MYEISMKRAMEYARGDAKMEKYVEISKETQNVDNGLWRSYDHELSYYESGKDEGREEGQINTIKKLITNGISKEKIIKILELNEEQIRKLDSK